MLALRFLGSLFLLIAVISLTADLSRPLPAAGNANYTSLMKHWSDFAPQSLATAQKTVQTKAHPVLWDPVIRYPLGLPAFATLGGLGLVLLYLGRPRRRVEIFVN